MAARRRCSTAAEQVKYRCSGSRCCSLVTVQLRLLLRLLLLLRPGDEAGLLLPIRLDRRLIHLVALAQVS